MKSVGIGIVGLGRWGKNYLKTIYALDRAKIFIADTAPDIPDGLSPGFQITSFDAMLDNPEVAAVIIATPDNTHYELAVQALKKGKDVIVEKPMALLPEHAAEMVQLSEDQKLILLVGHTSLYSVEFETLKQELQQGGTGKITRLEAFRSSAGKPQGDIIWDLAPHDIAMAISLMGEPISAGIKKLTADSAVYEIIFPGDVLFTGTVNWGKPPFQRWLKVVGTAKTLVCAEPVGCNHSLNSPLTRLCQDFLSCCRIRTRPVSDASLGLKVTRCLWMIKRPET